MIDTTVVRKECDRGKRERKVLPQTIFENLKSNERKQRFFLRRQILFRSKMYRSYTLVSLKFQTIGQEDNNALKDLYLNYKFTTMKI